MSSAKRVKSEVKVSASENKESTTSTFLSILQMLRNVDGEFPLQYSICLAEISMEEGMSLTALSKKTGLGLSTVSRIVGALSMYRQNGNPYGLVEIKVSEVERRRKELYLTDKGRRLLSDIGAVLQG